VRGGSGAGVRGGERRRKGEERRMENRGRGKGVEERQKKLGDGASHWRSRAKEEGRSGKGY